MKHLWAHWKSVERKLRNKLKILFLDFDGTLAPIAPTPDRAAMPSKAKRLLRALSEKPDYKLAVISGRPLNEIRNLVGLDGIAYAGNHGLEIIGPNLKYRHIMPQLRGGQEVGRFRRNRRGRLGEPSLPIRHHPITEGTRRHPISSRRIAVLAGIKDELERKLCPVNGVLLEDKGFSLALHFRLADKKYITKIKRIFRETVARYAARKEIKITYGKMVIEAGASVKWDKGKAVLWLIERQNNLLKGKRVFPIYLGDDKTDEDAFTALKTKGLTIFVGKPRRTNAEYYVKDTDDVAEILKRLCRNC